MVALGAINECDTESATLLACRDAPVLPSHTAGLALPSGAVDASEAAVASLFSLSLTGQAKLSSAKSRDGLVIRDYFSFA